MNIDSSIYFSSGVNYVLVIDTNTYSGNFEREVAAYVVGAYDEERYHGAAQLEKFEEDALDIEVGDQLNALQAMVVSQIHKEYGEVTNTIWPTPGRLNNGTGGHYNAMEGETGYPAYESVAIFVDGKLDAAQLKIVRDRAIKYGADHINLSGKPAPFLIRSVHMVRVEMGTGKILTASDM